MTFLYRQPDSAPLRHAAPRPSVRTDPGRARRVIAESRRDFDEHYPDLQLSPVVGLICAFEEEDNIGAVLAAMPSRACGHALSTLVLVDGGHDDTDRVARDAAAITYVLRENLGQGYALRVGYALCIELGVQFVVTLDADGQNDPAEIPIMLAPVVDGEADFVVASRRLGNDGTTDRVRKVGVRVFSWVMGTMGGTTLTDTSNGYRALRVRMLEDVAHRLTQSQYQTAELLLVCMKRGWRVVERPTSWLPRASGTTKKGKNYLFGPRYGRVVLTTWLRYRKGSRALGTKNARTSSGGSGRAK